MDNKDLFAPPSAEELELFAAPTAEELKQFTSPVEVPKSTLESAGETALDVGRGVLSGLTFGGLEEITAAGKAALSSEKEDFSSLYRKFLDIEEQKERAAKERSPTASFVGEIGGALLPAFVTGGTALAATGGRAAAQLGGKELLKAAGKAALVEGAFGAGGGALAGGLSSEGKLIGATEQEKQKLLEDVESGALTGGAFGAAMGAASPYVAKGIGKVKEKIPEAMDKFLLSREMRTSFGMGEEGKGFISSAQREFRREDKNKVVEWIRGLLKTAEDVTAEEFKKPLAVASEMGASVRPPEAMIDRFGKASDLFKSFGYDDIANDLVEMSVDGVTPSKAYDIRSKLKDLSQNQQFGGFANNLVKTIDDQIENSLDSDIIRTALTENNLSTSYKKGLKTYSEFLSSTIEAIIEDGRPPDARGSFFYDLPTRDKKLRDKIDYLVTHLELPGTTSEKARNALLDEKGGLVPMLSKMIKEDPETLDRIAQETGKRLNIDFKDANDLKNKLVKKTYTGASEATASRISQGEREISQGIGIGDIFSRRPLITGSNIAGQAEYYTGAFARQLGETSPGKLSSFIYNLPENKLRELSIKYMSDPKFGKYATQLGKALDSGDNVKKQAVLFALLQQPDFRNRIPDALEEDEENE